MRNEQATFRIASRNFGPAPLALPIAERAFDLLKGFETRYTIEAKLAQYEKLIDDNLQRIASTRRVENTAPSHPLQDYVGTYEHPGYGRIEILQQNRELVFKRYSLQLTLQHWHYDAWTFADHGLFAIHQAHAFDRSSRLLFETSSDGDIAAFTLPLEHAVAPIRFQNTAGLTEADPGRGPQVK